MSGDFETVSLSADKKELVIIDQTLLPGERVFLSLKTKEEIFEAIRSLRVRGAPAIGVAAAIGVYVCSRDYYESNREDPETEILAAADYIGSARPTAVNLRWAVDRMKQSLKSHSGENAETVLDALLATAEEIYREDIECSRRIGEFGLPLLHGCRAVLTHCNAGRLAAVKYGTATAPIYLAHENGIDIRVYCDETRPLLQGARLTSFELSDAGIPVTLLCDNMAGSAMRNGLIDAVIVGCDRVAANGDFANKIGTSMVALCAKEYGIPFYVAAPRSTIDLNTGSGKQIVIEQREPDEVTDKWFAQRSAPQGIDVYNPAFDVTDSSLVTAFITDGGVVYPPFSDNILALFEVK